MARERRDQHLQAVLELARDLERVGAVLGRGLDQYAGLPLDDRSAKARRGAVAHLRHVADAYRHAVVGSDHRLRQRFGRVTRRLRLQHDALAGGLEIAATGHAGTAARGLEYLVERHARAIELQRVDPQLPLTRIAAEDLHLRHAGYGEDLRLDGPADQVAQLDRRQPLAGEAEVHQVLHRGAERRQQRRADPGRQQRARTGKALADDLPLQVRVAAAPEHDLDRGQSLARGRAHRVDVLGTGEQVLQRPRHQRLHLHGVEAGSLRLNQQVRRREVGKYVEARRDQCADAEQRDQH